MTRLNKFIADSGITSRRKAEEYILQGRVQVNNKTVNTLSFKVDVEKDEVRVDGEQIKKKKHLYFLLNKPFGVISTTKDEKKRESVVDLINSNEKIFPIGRLDYNTTGVLLLTNDGEFSNLMSHPRNKIPRVYEVTLDRKLEEEDREKLLTGVYIEGKKGVFKELEFYKAKESRRMVITCTEGRNRFVKKMFSTLGYTVKDLNRKSFANIEADIPLGKYRKLTKEEINSLIKMYAK